MTSANIVTSTVTSLLAVGLLAAAEGSTAAPVPVAVASGTVKFVATTNLSAVSVHGQSTELTGKGVVRRKEGQVVLEEVEAKVDPKSLNTGMAVRDQHMRNKIFAQGEALPELLFTAARSECQQASPGAEGSCQLQGEFRLRGVTRPFAMKVKVQPSGQGYRVTGTGAVKLTAFGIEPPCQLGVCVNDDVKVTLDFQAREQR